MQQIKISVIIPVYNVEKYLKQCIDSVINQTLKDIEIIAVNDGSTDNSLKILEQYNDIKILTQKNGGLSAARNLGMQEAIGEYIYFLDSDDYIDLDTLEIVYDKMQKNDLDQCIFNNQEFKEDNDEFVTRIHFKCDYTSICDGKTMFQLMSSNQEYVACVPFRVIKRSLINEERLTFYNGIIHEDELFSFQLMMCSERCAILNNPFYHRRIRSMSITNNVNHEKKWTGMSTVLHYMIANQGWKQSTEEQLYWINRWFILIFDIAKMEYFDLDKCLQYHYIVDYKLMLEDARKCQYFGNRRVQLVCKFRKTHRAYRGCLKVVKTIFSTK